MSQEAIISAFQQQASNVDPLGAKIKFVLDEHAIIIDGTQDNNDVRVSDAEEEADCTISTTMEDFMKLKNGDLNPMMAVMTGKVKIKGDMGLAMKLQSLI